LYGRWGKGGHEMKQNVVNKQECWVKSKKKREGERKRRKPWIGG